MRHPHRRVTLFAAAIAAALVMTACGASEETDSSASAPSEPPVAESSPPAASEPSEAESPAAAGETALSDAEVQFLQAMIPHHQSAIEMAELVPEPTERPELRELAEAIIGSQEAEIEQMRSLLTEAGEDPDAVDGMDMDMGDETMSEMMDP
jgi:uncharacterized protein (DUF305 family)